MATKKAGTQVIKWEEQLAKEAEIAAGMEANAASGQFFSIKGGILAFNDAPLPGNQMAVVLLDGILENVFYEGEYDPENPAGPMCFAFGRDEKSMEPHKLVVEAGNAQHDHCAGCAMNEWGTALKGKGKACRNTRRLAMIPAGTIDQAGKFKLIDNAEHFNSAALAYLRLPVTSVKGYAAFVKQVAGALKRPPFGIVTKVQVIPDPKTQFRVIFEPVMNLPDELMPAVMTRHDEAATAIDFPYRSNEEEETKKPVKSRAAQRPPVKKNRKY